MANELGARNTRPLQACENDVEAAPASSPRARGEAYLERYRRDPAETLRQTRRSAGILDTINSSTPSRPSLAGTDAVSYTPDVSNPPDLLLPGDSDFLMNFNNAASNQWLGQFPAQHSNAADLAQHTPDAYLGGGFYENIADSFTPSPQASNHWETSDEQLLRMDPFDGLVASGFLDLGSPGQDINATHPSPFQTGGNYHGLLDKTATAGDNETDDDAEDIEVFNHTLSNGTKVFIKPRPLKNRNNDSGRRLPEPQFITDTYKDKDTMHAFYLNPNSVDTHVFFPKPSVQEYLGRFMGPDGRLEPEEIPAVGEEQQFFAMKGPEFCKKYDEFVVDQEGYRLQWDERARNGARTRANRGRTAHCRKQGIPVPRKEKKTGGAAKATVTREGPSKRKAADPDRGSSKRPRR